MMPYRTGLFLLLLSFVSATGVRAATMTFTKSADFLAAAAGLNVQTETYEDLAPGTIIFSGQEINQISYFGFPTGVSIVASTELPSIDSQSLTAKRTFTPGVDPNFDVFEKGDSFVVEFPTPVFAAGIFFNAEPTAASNAFFLQTTVGTASTGGAAAGREFGTFFFAGLISDQPFQTATIGSDLINGGNFNVDNLMYAAPIPEPGTAGLLALGLGAGFLTRRRRRS